MLNAIVDRAHVAGMLKPDVRAGLLSSSSTVDWICCHISFTKCRAMFKKGPAVGPDRF